MARRRSRVLLLPQLSPTSFTYTSTERGSLKASKRSRLSPARVTARLAVAAPCVEVSGTISA